MPEAAAEVLSYYEWLKSTHPVFQTLFRALQSTMSRIGNGADVTVRRGRAGDGEYLGIEMRRAVLAVEYDPKGKLLTVLWETRREGLDFRERRFKRASIEVQDEKLVRDLLEHLEDVVITGVRYGHSAHDLMLLLRPYAEELAKGRERVG
jgi:hypothetical protein